MTDRERNNEINELRRRYRAIEAPPYLATRVLATVESRAHSGWKWRTATVSGIVAVALIALIRLSIWDSPTSVPTPGYPSMSALADSIPAKPDAPLPSLASIGAYSVVLDPA